MLPAVGMADVSSRRLLRAQNGATRHDAPAAKKIRIDNCSSARHHLFRRSGCAVSFPARWRWVERRPRVADGRRDGLI